MSTTRCSLKTDTRTLQRFWGHVDCSSSCWEFSGTRNARGYGLFYAGRSIGAHRYAWFLEHGVEPTRKEYVCHSCDNPSCVRPSHLFLGSQSENLRDCSRKGRTAKPRGEKNGRARLTEGKVREVRQLAASGVTYKEISKRYGVHVETIGHVVRRITWKHVS